MRGGTFVVLHARFIDMNENPERGRWPFRSGILLIIALLLPAACGIAPLPAETLPKRARADGIYEGSYSSWPNSATVTVSVKDARITDIVIVRHFASWIGKKAEPVIPLRIIAAQSTRVDAVSGATNSSRVIMNAVQDALDKSLVAAEKVF
jgi:uncharacterized protein with FMN-binding domain